MMGLFRWFWYVAIGNPIVVRTICGGSRRMRHQWVRMGYLGVLIAMVTLGLMTGGGMAGAVSLTELAKAGTWLFAIAGFGQVTLICLLAFSAVLAGGVYVGVVYAAINSMVRGFDQTVRRISGQS